MQTHPEEEGRSSARGVRLVHMMVVLAGVAALTAAPSGGPSGVSYFDQDQVKAAFARGTPILEVDGYKIHASRREGPGQAEIHERDTDIVYVLDGEATIVTGGAVIEGRSTALEEVRGTSIQGGSSRRLVRGDVLVVPNGVPHWFREVKGPFLYYVVKVRS